MAGKTICIAQRNYKQQRRVVDSSVPSEVADAVDHDLCKIVAPEALLEAAGGFLVSDNILLVIFTTLQLLSKSLLTLGAEVADLILNFVDDNKSLRAAATEAEKKIRGRKRLASVAKKCPDYAFSGGIDW